METAGYTQADLGRLIGSRQSAAWTSYPARSPHVAIAKCGSSCQALALPGEAKVDGWITQEIARRIGLPWNYRISIRARSTPGWHHLCRRSTTSWERIEQESTVTYPSDAPDNVDGGNWRSPAELEGSHPCAS
jgi:hypothetical protein